MKEDKTQARLVENWQIKLMLRLGILPSRPDYEGKLHWRDAAIVIPLFWSWVTLLSAISYLIVSFLLDALALEGWTLFQRSGAVLVAAGSFVQIRMPNYEDWAHHRVLRASMEQTDPYDLFLDWSFRFYRLSWYAIVIGTIVWAYGDWLVDRREGLMIELTFGSKRNLRSPYCLRPPATPKSSDGAVTRP